MQSLQSVRQQAQDDQPDHSPLNWGLFHFGGIMERSIFTITLIQEGDTITIHAAHTGEKSTAFKAGMALLANLSETDSVDEALLAAHTPAPAWVQ